MVRFEHAASIGTGVSGSSITITGTGFATPSIIGYTATAGSNQLAMHFDAKTTTIGFTKLGQASSIQLPGGLQKHFMYDSRHRPQTLSFGNPPVGGMGAPLGRTYTYDSVGRMRKRESSTHSHHFDYDEVGQIKRVDNYVLGPGPIVCDPWDPTTCYQQDEWLHSGARTWAWDAVGNPTDRNAITTWATGWCSTTAGR